MTFPAATGYSRRYVTDAGLGRGGRPGCCRETGNAHHMARNTISEGRHRMICGFRTSRAENSTHES